MRLTQRQSASGARTRGSREALDLVGSRNADADGSLSLSIVFRLLLGVGCALVVGACAIAPPIATDIQPDEEVVLFPTAAHFDEPTSRWIVPIHGWIYERPDDSLWTSAAARAFMRALDLDDDALAQAVFRARAGSFLAGGEEDRRLAVRVGPWQVTADASGPNGLFRATATLSAGDADRYQRAGRLPLELAGPAGERRRSGGHAQLVGERGVSVVSDIDDTVKISNVRDRRALMANTFLNPFEAVPGMARAYAALADGGAMFHYVSSSPWQLYPALSQFFAAAGLPVGSFHLREIGLGDRSFLDLFDTPADAKVPTIAEIIRRWPQRRFVLVGDSGEQDPEIYARIYREFPDNVLHIFIRNVTDEGDAAPRHREVFAEVPRERWTVFTDPGVLTMRVRLPAQP